MRRILLLLLLALTAGGLLSLGLRHDSGYIRISLGNILIETNFWVGLALVLTLVLVLHLVWQLLSGLRRSPLAINRWASSGGRKRARIRTTRGLLSLAEGNWARAEKLLSGAAPRADTPLISYLASAQAAYEQGAHDRMDQWLRQAFESTPGSDLAVGITQAQLQLGSNQLESCLATLLRLREQAPRHPFVLKLLHNVYLRLEDWRALRDLLPDLHSRNVLPDAELTALEQTVWLRLLEQAAESIQRQQGSSRTLEPLDSLWDSLPADRRKDETIIAAYTTHLARLQAEAQAETLLRKVLRHHWSDALVALYGKVKGADPSEQLQAAQRWLQEHPDHPGLLLALGRICLRSEQREQAREYLEASLRLQRNRETVIELCRLAIQQGDHPRCTHYLMQGLLDPVTPAELPESKGHA